MRRNPENPQRFIEANEHRTQKQIERYYGKVALLATWEKESDEVQSENHAYLLKLRATVRTIKTLLLHRASAKVQI